MPAGKSGVIGSTGLETTLLRIFRDRTKFGGHRNPHRNQKLCHHVVLDNKVKIGDTSSNVRGLPSEVAVAARAMVLMMDNPSPIA